MRKSISILMIAAMLLSVSAFAFAVNSPSQNEEPAPAQWWPRQEKVLGADELTAEQKAAMQSEKDAVKNIRALEVLDDEGNPIVVELGAVKSGDPDGMSGDFEALIDALVNAKAALANDESGVIASALAAKLEDGMNPSAEQPFRAVASKYPVEVTIHVDNIEDLIGLMIWQNGRFVDLEYTADFEESTVTFTLSRPSVICLVFDTVVAP